MTGEFILRLPATSANLGPAFDTAAVAWNCALEVRAEASTRFQLEAEGRDTEVCGGLRDHLIVEVYCGLLARAGQTAAPLRLRLRNAIPISKGCGSSAAARLAGAALASHFGGLGWSAQRVFEEAARLEGHPDNAAACWWGGLVVAQAEANGAIHWLAVPTAASWRLLLAVPANVLATEAARRALPEVYTRADAVANLQCATLLLEAWRQGREDLMAAAMRDRWHQPYRAALCPLWPALEPLAGREGILGCALSGAGPSVLLLVKDAATARQAVEGALAQAGLEAELLEAAVETEGPGLTWERA